MTKPSQSEQQRLGTTVIGSKIVLTQSRRLAVILLALVEERHSLSVRAAKLRKHHTKHENDGNRGGKQIQDVETDYDSDRCKVIQSLVFLVT